MARVALAYGPPGHKGVTTLMSVGASEAASTIPNYEPAVRSGSWLALGVWVLGLATGNRQLESLGFGASVALWGVRIVTR